MVRSMSFIFGVCLVILWITALNAPDAASWMTWLDGVAAIGAFIVSGTADPTLPRMQRVAGPIALSIGLYALWVIGLATSAVPWLCWWTFAFASAFLVLAVADATSRRSPISKIYVDEKFRKTG